MYGSFSELIKTKLGGSKDNMTCPADHNAPDTGEPSSTGTPDSINKTGGSVLHEQINSQVDKLDSLLTKADNAQYSMDHQNKQMKRFLNK
jgi:hypothetical protein